MKVTLYMAITPNGFIAKQDDNTDWISKEEWGSYSSAVRTAGNLIVGHRTYEILTKQSGFAELKDVKLVVISTKSFSTLSENHILVHSPKEALVKLSDFNEIIVAGGGELNAHFLEENLIDEIYLDIEPVIFGKGIPLFHSSNFEKKLKLIGQKNISENEIQLHYKVLK